MHGGGASRGRDAPENAAGVVLLGPRQVGKTTLARNIASRRAKSSALYLDLERPADQRRLQDAATFLRTQAGKWVVIDEIHRGPTLFEVLRGIIDDRRAAGEREDGAIVLDFPLEVHGFGALLWTCPVSVDSFLSSLLGDLCLYLAPFGILQRRAVWRRRRQKRGVLSWRSRVPMSPFVIDRRSIANG